MDRLELFEALCAELGTGPLRNGEAPINCPYCGKESDKNNVHASFSVRGFHCFVCSQSNSLEGFARKMNSINVSAGYSPRDRRPNIVQVRDTPKRRRYDILEHDPDKLASVYQAHPDRDAAWGEYAPMLTKAMIDCFRLGVGILPPRSSRCQHVRLQVPLIFGSHVVGFRSRALICDCGKWLGPGGNPSKFLYNGARILLASNRRVSVLGDSDMRTYIGDAGLLADLGKRSVLFIVENPVDAILLEQAGLPAVATLGVTCWEDAWTATLYRAQPLLYRIIVLYDNDAPGNGGGAKGAALWRKTHRGLEPPANGPKLVNRLRKAGLPAVLFPWGPEFRLKADIGDFLRHQPPDMSSGAW